MEPKSKKKLQAAIAASVEDISEGIGNSALLNGGIVTIPCDSLYFPTKYFPCFMIELFRCHLTSRK